MTDDPTPQPQRAAREDPRAALEEALHEIKRVIVGQDAMLERLLVALLAGGHVLLEGVPGLAKTLTVKTLAQVLGGTFSRIQFTPDLVPADLVGTRVYRPDTGRFDIELGPVFGNFLLADEINRAPAKVQSALLEVMQEQQVTIGGETFPVPAPVPRARDAEPDRVRGHLPAARGAGRPLPDEGRRRLPDAWARRRPSSAAPSAAPAEVRERLSLRRPRALHRGRRVGARRPRGHRLRGRRWPTRRATRRAYGLDDLEPYVEFGASPRGPIGLVQAARALALLRGRGYVTVDDVRDLAADVLRHRLVLSYDALGEGVTRRRHPRARARRRRGARTAPATRVARAGRQ